MAVGCWATGVSAAGYSEPEENGPQGRGYSCVLSPYAGRGHCKATTLQDVPE
jgi:hypothetical protein